jgi:hypothetical protein
MKNKHQLRNSAKWPDALLAAGLDHFWVAPKATRSISEYDRFNEPADLLAKYPDADRIFRCRIFLAHGGVNGAHCLIDDMFFFFTEKDARWFWEGGYNDALYEGENVPDHMFFGIDRKLVAVKNFADEMKTQPYLRRES